MNIKRPNYRDALDAATAASGVACGALVILLVVSYHLDSSRNGIVVSPRFHLGFFDGRAWFYSYGVPYQGGTMYISDGK